MNIFNEFAKKYFLEAEKDLSRARRFIQMSDYPQAVFYT
jgi:HEPN domain-containing protein